MEKAHVLLRNFPYNHTEVMGVFDSEGEARSAAAECDKEPDDKDMGIYLSIVTLSKNVLDQNKTEKVLPD